MIFSTARADRLAWLDQLAYELLRYTGRSQRMQCIWVYDRPIDGEALERVNKRLSELLFNRLIEPSTVPVARPRWVKPKHLVVPIEKSQAVIPHSHLMRWANEHARRPINPVSGPAWRMALQSFDNGSTAVSIVGSHVILDGMGAMSAIAAAIRGEAIPNPYDSEGSRGYLVASTSDIRQILADTPATLRALSKLIRAKLRDLSKAGANKQPTENHHVDDLKYVALPTIAITIAANSWDDCALRLKGHPNLLFPAIVAKLAAELNRKRNSDGDVALIVPVNQRRSLSDTRALGIEFRTLIVPTFDLTNKIGGLRAPLMALLRDSRTQENEVLSLMLPAIAWIPRTITKAITNKLFTYADQPPVSCSNLGSLPEELGMIDGTQCSQLIARAVDVDVTLRDLNRSNGHLVVIGSRFKNQFTICIEAWQLSPKVTTNEDLCIIVSKTLNEFGLEGIINY